MRKTAVATAATLAAAITAQAQISQPGTPASVLHDLPDDIPTATMPAPDLDQYKAEDEANNHWPLRYGAVIGTTLASDFTGQWDVAPDGTQVWRQRISSPGAYTLGIVFDIWNLQEGAMVFLYDDTQSSILGAYTSFHNNVNGSLGIEPSPGDAVIVEYVVPADIEHPAVLQIGEVIHDYRDVMNLLSPSGTSSDPGGCGLVGINCPEGQPYQDIKRAAIRTLAGGGLCSASILNNTNQDGTPYMLTANHCGSMVNGVFTFNFEQATCGVNNGPTNQTMSGSVQLAASSTYDSRLYRLNNNIPSEYNPYYAGWNRGSATGIAPAISIGHGGGQPKQIAIDNTGASSSGVYWAAFWHVGTVIGGNSGGPLFDGNKRVVGPACCVNNFSCGSQTTFYGKFSSFWNAGNLQQWLAPGGSAPTTLDGFDPSANCGSATNYGAGCTGFLGVTPQLDMSGCFTAGGTVTMDIAGGLGGSTALVFFGLNQSAIPDGQRLHVEHVTAPSAGARSLAAVGHLRRPGRGIDHLADSGRHHAGYLHDAGVRRRPERARWILEHQRHVGHHSVDRP